VITGTTDAEPVGPPAVIVDARVTVIDVAPEPVASPDNVMV
jgi:hypothetical protein